jgi:hypothetical protein
MEKLREMEKLVVNTQVREAIVFSAFIDDKWVIKCYDDDNGIKEARKLFINSLPVRARKIVFKRVY